MWLKGDQLAELPPPPWLIESVLPEASAAALVGDPGMGKTFIALDMAAALANGVLWHGFETRKSAVAYVIAEGTGGMPERLRALRAVYPVDALAFWPREVPLRSAVHVDAFAQEVAKLDPPPRLIIVDTLARCFVGGDENSAKDMGEFVHGVDRLRRLPSKPAVLVVHHSGHVKGRERGSTALRGAVDTLFLVQRSAENLVLSCEKQREASPFDPIGLALREIEVGDVTSCVVVDGPAPTANGGPIAPPPWWTGALGMLSNGGLRSADWQRACKRPAATFHRMRRTMLQQGLIVKDGEMYRRKG